jgi:hypothetical protein
MTVCLALAAEGPSTATVGLFARFRICKGGAPRGVGRETPGARAAVEAIVSFLATAREAGDGGGRGTNAVLGTCNGRTDDAGDVEFAESYGPLWSPVTAELPEVIDGCSRLDSCEAVNGCMVRGLFVAGTDCRGCVG